MSWGAANIDDCAFGSTIIWRTSAESPGTAALAWTCVSLTPTVSSCPRLTWPLMLLLWVIGTRAWGGTDVSECRPPASAAVLPRHRGNLCMLARHRPARDPGQFRRSGDRGGSPQDSHPDQARYRRDWREPELRSRLRHLCPAERRFDLESIVGSNRPFGRFARAEFRCCATVQDLGPDELLHRRATAEQDRVQDPARADPGRRAEHAKRDLSTIQAPGPLLQFLAPAGRNRAVVGTG